jgi:hypothetical protein
MRGALRITRAGHAVLKDVLGGTHPEVKARRSDM